MRLPSFLMSALRVRVGDEPDHLDRLRVVADHALHELHVGGRGPHFRKVGGGLGGETRLASPGAPGWRIGVLEASPALRQEAPARTGITTAVSRIIGKLEGYTGWPAAGTAPEGLRRPARGWGPRRRAIAAHRAMTCACSCQRPGAVRTSSQ